MEVDVSSSLRDSTSDQIAVVKTKSENLMNKKVTNEPVCGINRSGDDKKAGENCISNANNFDPVVIENSEVVSFEDKKSKKKNDSVCGNNCPDDVKKSGENCMANENNSDSIDTKCSEEVQHKLKKVRPGKRDTEALHLNGPSKSSSGVGTGVIAAAAAENDTSEPGSSIVDNGPNLVGGTVANSCLETELPDSMITKINKGKQHSCTDTDNGAGSTSSTLETECRSNSKYCSSKKLVSTEEVVMTENIADLGGAVPDDSTDLPGNATAESDTDLESQKRKKNNNRKKRQTSNDGTANEVICGEGSAENKQTSMSSSPIRSATETLPVSALVTTENVLSGSSCTSNIPVPQILVSPGKKKLLVLDINGLLADINSDFRYTEHADFKISGKLVFKRPFCADFLNFCFANFEIGVWSSRKKYNVEKAVQYLMGDLRNQLLFCWDQSKCTATNFNTIDNSCKPLVFKELKKLWEKEEPNLPWEKGRFTPSNTLLVDDSPYKAFCNPPFTAIFPPPYSFKHKEDNSLGIRGDLRIYLEKVATAEHVQYYVKDNPFGQPAITDLHPNWKFYLRIIENLDKPLGSA